MRKQEKDQSLVDLKLTYSEAEYDPIADEWIGLHDSKIVRSFLGRDGTIVKEETSLVRCKENTESSEYISKQLYSREKLYPRFVQSDGCLVDFAGLSVKAIKLDPLMTTIYLGNQSLVFDIHDNTVSNKIKFFVKTDNEEITKTQTSGEFKTDCPCKYTFVWEAPKYALSLFVNGVKRLGFTAGTAGYFGLIPTVVNSLFTLNPFRTFYPSCSQANSLSVLAVELSAELKDKENPAKEISALLATNGDFELVAASEDKNYLLGFTSGFLQGKVDAEKDKNTYHLVEDLNEFKKKSESSSPTLVTFVESHASLIDRSSSLSATPREGTPEMSIRDNETSKETDNKKLHYIHGSDTLIVYGENSIKLLKRKQGKFRVQSNLFDDTVTSEDQLTSLEISTQEATVLLSVLKNQFIKYRSDGVPKASIIQFLVDLSKRVPEASKSILICEKFSTLVQIFSSLLYSLINTLKSCPVTTQESPAVQEPETENQTGDNHDVMVKLFGGAGDDDHSTEERQKEQKPVQLNTSSYFAARILIELLEKLRAKSLYLQADKLSFLHSTLSTMNRLASYARSKNCGADFFELAENGLYNNYNSYCTNQHFLVEEKPISGLDQIEVTQQSIFEILSANGMNLQDVGSILNIPLSSFVNHMPAINYNSNISKVGSDATGKLFVLLENADIFIYDTELCLVLNYTGNLREEAKKRLIGDNLIDKKGKVFFNLDTSINEKVFEAIADQKKPMTEEDNPENIEPDAGKLEYLYQMGFSLELARKALIKTKNQSVDLAIEMVLSMQATEKPEDREALQEAVSLIRPIWSCEMCTFNNDTSEIDTGKDTCQMCGSPAPIFAYYTKEEIDQMKEEQAMMVQAEMEKEQTKLAEQRKQEEATAVSTALEGELVDIKIGCLETNFMTRLLVAAAFNSEAEKAATIRIRRIGYSTEYLKTLIQEISEGNVSVTYIRLGNEVVVDTDGVLLEKSLSEYLKGKAKTQLDSLVPFYCFGGKVMEAVDQSDIKIEGQVIGLEFSSSSKISKETAEKDSKKETIDWEVKQLFVLYRAASGELKIQTYDILSRVFDCFNIQTQVKSVADTSVGSETGACQPALLHVNNEWALVHNGKVAIYSNDLNQLRTINLGEISYSKLAVSGDRIVFFDQSNRLFELNIHPESCSSAAGAPATQTAVKSVLTCEDILNFMHQKKHVQFQVDTYGRLSTINHDDPDGVFTFKSTVIAPSKSTNLRLSLKTQNNDVKNGIFNLTFGFSQNIKADRVQSPVVKPPSGVTSGINILDANEESQFLPLNVVHHSFGDVNAMSLIGSALFSNTQFYSGKRAEVNYVFLENQYQLDMTVKQATLISKARDNFAQITSALVFTTNSTGIVHKFDLRHLGQKAEYKKWHNQKIIASEKFEEFEPIGFLDPGSAQSKDSAPLDFVRKARYLCLVFCLDGKKNAFNINFIGAKGSSHLSTEPNNSDYSRASLPSVDTGYELSLVNHDTIIGEKKKLQVESSTKEGQVTVYNLNFYDRLKEVILELDVSPTASHRLEYITIEIIKCGSNADNGLKEIFENRHKLLELMKAQASRLSEETVSLDEKKRIISMFSDMIVNFDANLAQQIHEFINVEYLVNKVILKAIDNQILGDINSLFDKFSQIQAFTDRVQNTIATAIDNIGDIETNRESLRNFFKLVDTTMINPKYGNLSANLQGLVAKAILKLQEVSSREDRLMRGLDYTASFFDISSFWNLTSSKKAGPKADELNDFLSLDYLVVKSPSHIDVYCDLRKEVFLRRLLVKFNQMSKSNPDIFSFMSLYKVTLQDNSWAHATESLLFTREVNSSFIFYSNKTARDSTLNFANAKDLYNALGYRLDGVSGRFFKVRLTFDSSKFTKTPFKLSKQQIDTLFYGSPVDDQVESSEAVLPNIPLNPNAKLAMGEVLVIKKTLKGTTQAPAATQTPVEASAAPTKEASQTGGAVEEIAEKTAGTGEGIQSATSLLLDCLMNIKGDRVSQEESLHIKDIAENLLKVREESNDWTKNTKGKDSFNFWIMIIDLAGSSNEIQKINFALTFDHFKGIIEHVVMAGLDQKVQDICLKLMKNCIAKDSSASVLKTLKKLISFLSTREKLPQVISKNLITVIHSLFSSVEGLSIYELVNYMLTKLCKKFEEDREHYLLQMNFIFELLFLFNNPVTVPAVSAEGSEVQPLETVVMGVLYSTLNIILWTFEQDLISDSDKLIFSEKAIKLFNQVFRLHKAILPANFKIEKGIFEMLLVRSFKLNLFRNLESIFESIFSLGTMKDGEKISKEMLLIQSDVLTQLVNYLKEDQEGNMISHILKEERVSEEVKMEFLSFLIKNCDVLNKQATQVAPKPEEIKEDDHARPPMRKKRTMNADELDAHRSLSARSQNIEKQDDSSISANTIRDLISIYTKKQKVGVANLNLFTQMSKLIVTKSLNKEYLKMYLEIYNLHSISQKTLITNQIIDVASDIIESLKKGKQPEEENHLLKDFLSNLLESVVDMISNTGLDSLDDEFTKLLLGVQELVLGPEIRKGPAGIVKTLASSISTNCVSSVFFFSAKELNRLCNWGGPDGYDSLEKARITYLDILMNFLSIVTLATSSAKSLILNELVANLKSINLSKISDAIAQLLEWNVFNNLITTKKSPSMDRLVKIAGSVDQIFKALAENPEAGKIMIRKMFDIVNTVHEYLMPKINSDAINFIGISIIYSLFGSLEKVLEITLKDNHMINFFVLESKGIHFIFDLLNLSYELKKDVSEDQKAKVESVLTLLTKVAPDASLNEVAQEHPTPAATSVQPKSLAPNPTPKPVPLFATTSQTFNPNVFATPTNTTTAPKPVIPSPTPAPTTAQPSTSAGTQPQLNSAQSLKANIPCTNPDRFSEEFAKDMKCLCKINGKDEKTTDWQKNKKTGGKHIFVYQMNNENSRNSRELLLDFQINQHVDLRTIKAGFLSQYNDFGNKIVAEPSYIHVHYKVKETDEWQYLCEMDKYEDNGYYISANVCYQKNFMRFEGSNFKQRIESVCIPKKITYLRFMIGRPIVSFQENYSALKPKDYNQLNLAPSYFSVLGINSSFYNLQIQNNYLKETTLLKLIHKVFSKDQKIFEALSTHTDLIDRFKIIFDRLVDDYVDLFTTPLISFSRNNTSFGIWVMNKLLDLKYKEEHAKVVGEIIMSSADQYQARLSMLCDFIMTEIAKDVESKIPHSDRLYNFMAVFSSCVHRVPGDAELTFVQTLNIDRSQIDLLVQFFKKIPYVQQFKNFFITLVYMPNKAFKLRFEQPMDYLIHTLSDSIKNQNDYVVAEPLSLIAISKKQYSRVILEENIADFLFKNIKQINGQCMISVLLFFRNIINHEECKKKIIDLKLPEYLFDHLKQMVTKEQNSQPKMQIIMILGLDIIKFVTSNDDSCAARFAELLYDQVKTISASQEDSSYFMDTIFLPILLTIRTQKLFLEKKIQKKAIIGFDDKTTNEESDSDFKLKSDFIPSELVPTLHTNLDVLLDSSTKDKFRNGKWEMIASTQQSSMDLSNAIEEQLLGQGAFMILIDGEASNLEYVLGIFCSTGLPKDPKVSQGSRDISVINSDNHFVFLYEKTGKQNTCHYRTKSSNESETFLRYNDKSDANDKGIQIYYMNLEKIFISFTDQNNNHIDLYPMKCLDTDPQPNFEFPFDFHMKRGLEIWKLSMPDADSNIKDGKLSNMFSMGPLNLNNELLNISYSYYRNSTVYNVPDTITLDSLKKSFFADPPEAFSYIGNKQVIDQAKSVAQLKQEAPQVDELDILDLEYNKDQDVKDININDMKDMYNPHLPILEHFIKIKGMEFILDSCINIITTSKAWTDKPYAATWEQITREIQTFAKIDFIPMFARSLTSIQTLLKIISKAQGTDKTWSANEDVMITSVCNAVAKLFKDNKSTELRDVTIKEGILAMILDKLQSISKETTRKYIEQEEVTEKPKTDVKKETKEDGKVIKRKGVGYEGVTNTNWSTDEFFKLAEAKNKKIKALLNIIMNILDIKSWNAPPESLKIITESCLLPLIENAFRCTSLLDMAKEKELYDQYLSICRAISGIDVLVPSLLPLDEKYKPKQTASIEKLLGQLGSGSSTFKQLTPIDAKATKAVEDTTKSAFALADEIIKVNDEVQKAISGSSVFKDKMAHDIEAINALPMEEKYKSLLENQRFGYTNMKDPKDTTKYIHHWKGNFSGKYAPQPAKMIRLAQEIADISNSLAIDSTNAMLVRADEERLDVMKAVIFGAEGCPYAHGAFEYDIYFDNDYPNVPPKVNLETTGNGDVRFNPNLYNCGKVCLSLLGTWRGNASESWDPKFSTLTQVLVSIQAVVMSEEVYFNEPGYGHEAGTEAGELKNTGYSNIVRLCNIKYGMIGQIENPSKGFENAIRAHFVMKKQKVLDTVHEWKKTALEKEATYTGLVADHNPNYCDRFKSKNSNYYDDLCAAIEKLEKTLNNLEMPSIDELLGSKINKLKIGREKKEKIALTEGQGKIDEIDMTYDENIQLKSMQDDEAGVKDRWSRYIGVMGMESVAKQANASIFISGLNSLGVEIAKNIVLSGAKRITLHDDKNTTFSDLAGQFFLGEADVGKNRAAACINKIQQLNFYVKVDLANKGEPLPDEDTELEKLTLKDYEVIVLVDAPHTIITAVSKLCRKHNRSLIVADCHGIFSRIFCDFGSKFVCFDKNGEEAQEVMIASITNEENAKVTLLEGAKHTFEDGDHIILRNVEGMKLLEEHKKEIKEGEEPPESVNGLMFKVKVINYNSFYIGDTQQFSKYIRGGLAKQIKLPFDIEFKPYHEIYDSVKPLFEPNLEYHDFMKVDHPKILHLCYLALNDFVAGHKRQPASYSLEDAKAFHEIFLKKAEAFGDFIEVDKVKESIEKLVYRFAMTLSGNFGPQAAYIGGIVSQEIVKAITGKFKPIVQTFYADSIEVLCSDLFPKEIAAMTPADYSAIALQHKIAPLSDRDDGIRTILGASMLETVKYSQLFMVGSGAIGCELLKNFAMISLGTGAKSESQPKEGKIILTDPDVIEVSNLNRQFLFREKHLRKPKSVTAAAAAQMMNPQLQGHLLARLDKVHEGTANIFSDQFFEEMSIVANALDNIQARKYIDARCVTARTPLIESGTLGPKGHVQVIIPNKTESYGSMKDPTEELDIPHCTLKMFPEETLHCVEWARDLFGSLFTQGPQALRKCLEEAKEGTLDNQDPKAIKDSLRLAKKAPKTFDECIKFARERFQKFFNYDIKQLLYVYPLDFKDKDGNPFWKLPKRPPTPLDFDPENKLHVDFIVSMAALRAKIFNLPLNEKIRDEAFRKEVAQKAAAIQMPDFKPNDEKAKEISKDVEKLQKKPGVEEMTEGGAPAEPVPAPEVKEESFDDIKKNFKTHSSELTSDNIKPEEFEKDNDLNYHIDSIYSMANLRATNYKLDPMDWITVKIKAGRIVPALATTTASIAGLQTLEVVKVLKKVDKEHIKNAFLNLAVPILTQSEPADAPKIEITKELTVTLWDRWEFSDCSNKTFEDIFKEFIEKYKVYPRDILQGAKSIYMKALGDSSMLKVKLGELFSAVAGDHEDVTVTCTADEAGKEPVQGIPPVRLSF
jgi:ubiquitin-activating enzyme E1